MTESSLAFGDDGRHLRIEGNETLVNLNLYVNEGNSEAIPWPRGTYFEIYNNLDSSTGVVNIVPQAGVTINQASGTLTIANQELARIYLTDQPDTWDMFIISSAGTTTPTDVYSIELLEESSTFDGTPFTEWSSGIGYVSTSFCHWDGGISRFVFDTNGLYRITISATAATSSPEDWPINLTSYGTTVALSVTQPNTRHSTYLTGGYPANFQGIADNTSAPAQRAAVWTDSYVFEADVNYEQSVGIYVANDLQQAVSAAVSAFVTIQYIGPSTL